MRRYTFAVVFCLFAFGDTGTTNGRHTPASMVELAVSKLESCPYRVSKFEVDADGTPQPAELDSEESAIARTLTLASLFRSGRFNYARHSDFMPIGGRRQIEIAFVPKDEPFQLRALPGEKGYINRAMNNLSGKVRIDPASGDIATIEAKLKKKVVFSPDLGEIEIVHLVYAQEMRDGRMRPVVLDITAKFWHRRPLTFGLLKRHVFDKYHLWYSCNIT